MTTAVEKADAATSWVGDLEFDQAAAGELPTRRRRWLRWLILVVVLAALAAAAVWFVNPFKAAAASLVTAKATTGTVVSSVSVSGSVASSTVDELSFGAAGTVAAVKVAVGARVTVGQILATIDDSALQVQIETGQANLTAAQARLATDAGGPTAATFAAAWDSVKQAQLQLSTARTSLSDTRLQNAHDIAQAKSAATAAKATLATDEATLPAGSPQLAKDQAAVSGAESALSAANLKATLALHQAEQQLASASLGLTTAGDNYNLKVASATAPQIASDKAAVASANLALTTLKQTGPNITAPIAGTVTAVNLKVGQTVSGSTGSSSGSTGSSSSSSTATGQIEVMDLTQLQIAGQASETDVTKLKMGQAATISASALGTETVVGKVCQLSVVGTQISGVTSFGVTVCLDASNPALLVGMSATAAVVTDRADNAVVVPTLAVKTVGGQQVVTVLGADGKTETNVPVTVGISNGSEVQITAGLTGNETVVETLQTTTTNRNGAGGRIFPGGGVNLGGG
jgi:multidrug efflux pump subunit AcrA (membrane-fusion protein)